MAYRNNDMCRAIKQIRQPIETSLRLLPDMRYFHVPLCRISDNKVNISGRELHHLADVLRLGIGDEITVLDGSGGIYDVVLISCGEDNAVGEIRTYQQARKPIVEVTLFAGLPKADKMDLIVQKTTELGAYRIVPVLCQHTLPHLSAERAQKRVVRWRQIAVEASKQSHRPFFPLVSNIMRFDEALKESYADLKLIFTASTSVTSKRLKDVLKLNNRATKVDAFIGPEGGFAEEEIRSALSSGAVPVSLGNNILRTETAAIAAITIVLYDRDATYNNGGHSMDHT